MSNSVARKFLSTTSLVAATVALAACSGEIERFGEPGSGYTSNQNEVFTNSTQTARVQPIVNQPMPAAVAAVQQPVYKAPIYSTPATVPVVSATQPAPVRLVTNSVSTATRVPVQSYPMPAPAAVQPVRQPVYQTVAAATPVRQAVDYTATGSVNSAILSKPPVVVSRFHSMPKAAPKAKRVMPVYSQQPVASSVRVPVQVPVAAQANVPQPVTQPSRFSISKFFSLPKKAPKTKAIDYRSTATITPPQPIPSGNSVPVVAPRQQVASAAPVTNPVLSGVRTSGSWTSLGGSMITVQPGEDIGVLSRRYGVPAKAIADVNGLVDQSFVAPGQRVLIPVYQQGGAQTYSQTASIDRNVVPAPSVIRMPKSNPLRLQSQTSYGREIVKMQQTANAEYRHMVMPGDTLGGIASRYNVSVSQLAQANGLSTRSNLRMGQRLHIPQNTGARGVDYTPTASIKRQPISLVPSVQQPTAPVFRLSKMPKSKPQQLVRKSLDVMKTQPSGVVASLPKAKRQRVASLPGEVGIPVDTKTVTGSINKPNQPTYKPVAKSGANQSPKFRWPVRGRIISNFGRKKDGGRNDGINLSVPVGTSVRVAESGTVIYSGSKLKGYGNLVLVQHENGWVTAYAHNEKLLVTKGQQVRRGQIIAQAGKSGSVESPQLHFELRIKGDPVDPVPHLVSS